MKLAVCVKHVPDGHLRIDPGSRRIDRSGQCDLNAFDLYALEEALRIRDEVAGEVVVITVGPEKAAESLRTALAHGADRAVLVSDPALAGSDLVATSRVLAKALEREAADLVFFGQQASDGGGAVLWAAVADRLQLGSVSQVTRFQLDGSVARITRQTELGDDTVEAALPLVVAVTDAINQPRYASLKGMMGAKRKPLETLSVSDLDLDAATVGEAGSMTEVRALGQPPSRGGATRIEDEEGAAPGIVDFLADRQLV